MVNSFAKLLSRSNFHVSMTKLQCHVVMSNKSFQIPQSGQIPPVWHRPPLRMFLGPSLTACVFRILLTQKIPQTGSSYKAGAAGDYQIKAKAGGPANEGKRGPHPGQDTLLP